MKPFKFFLLLIYFYLYGAALFAQTQTNSPQSQPAAAVDPSVKKRIEALNKNSIKVFPLLYYTPEMGPATGVFTNFHLRNYLSDTTSRSTDINSSITITLKKQASFENTWVFFSDHENWFSSGKAHFFIFPEYFYGLGKNAKQENKMLYSYKLVDIEARITHKVKPHLYAGVYTLVQKMFDVEAKDQEKAAVLKNPNVPGNDGYFASGAGPMLVYDSRNHGINPYAGTYAEYSMAWCSPVTFSKFNYNVYYIDLRKYMALYKTETVLTVQNVMQVTTGNVPFRLAPALGGDRFLRGYYRGRFRDKCLLIQQAELKFPIFRKFGGAVFTGIGQVVPNIQSYALDQYHLTGGLGIRYRIRNNDRANLRLDLGLTKEGPNFYFVFGEAL